MGRGMVFLFFILYLAIGLYCINVGFPFFNTPEFLLGIDRWITFAGGILLVFGGINVLRNTQRSNYR